jgi:hypothetical protein
VTLLGLVAEPTHVDGQPSHAEQPQEPGDAHRAIDRHDAHALPGRVTVAQRGQRLHRALVAGPFDEHNSGQAVVGKLASHRGGRSSVCAAGGTRADGGSETFQLSHRPQSHSGRC